MVARRDRGMSDIRGTDEAHFTIIRILIPALFLNPHCSFHQLALHFALSLKGISGQAITGGAPTGRDAVGWLGSSICLFG
jgi:hypothetical protein